MATKTSNTGRESDKFTLRFSEGMREQIRKAAESNNRTMNAEIVDRLQQSFSPAEEQRAQMMKQVDWLTEQVLALTAYQKIESPGIKILRDSVNLSKPSNKTKTPKA